MYVTCIHVTCGLQVHFFLFSFQLFLYTYVCNLYTCNVWPTSTFLPVFISVISFHIHCIMFQQSSAMITSTLGGCETAPCGSGDSMAAHTLGAGRSPPWVGNGQHHNAKCQHSTFNFTQPDQRTIWSLPMSLHPPPPISLPSPPVLLNAVLSPSHPYPAQLPFTVTWGSWCSRCLMDVCQAYSRCHSGRLPVKCFCENLFFHYLIDNLQLLAVPLPCPCSLTLHQYIFTGDIPPNLKKTFCRW